VWVTNDGSGTLVKLDPKTGAQIGPALDVHGGADSVAVGEGAVWVGLAESGRLAKVDGASGKIVDTIKFAEPSPHADVAIGGGAVFYVNSAGKAWRINPQTDKQVGKPVVLSDASSAAAVAGRALWVADPLTGKLLEHPFS
jgi:DNA-binding beta-propeller fold protein YncE